MKQCTFSNLGPHRHTQTLVVQRSYDCPKARVCLQIFFNDGSWKGVNIDEEQVDKLITVLKEFKKPEFKEPVKSKKKWECS